jgi:hypothetical protein|tara:strand:+ start:315 stop:629 length:315 start_codon:yes stop_codon:yes gene_type:complete
MSNYKTRWDAYVDEVKGEELGMSVEDPVEDEDDGFVMIKDTALQRLLLDYQNHLSMIEETTSHTTKEDRIKQRCRRLGFRSFVEWIKMQSAMNAAEKGKFHDGK